MAIRFGQRPGQPVQARHDQGVAGPQIVQAGRQLGPVGVLAGQLVGEDAEAAGLGQGVLLAVQKLPGGADPGVADQGTGPSGRFRGEKVAGGFGGFGGRHSHTRNCIKNGFRWIDRHAGFTTPFTTLARRRGARPGAHW